jgi:hypothetical protein
MTGFSCDLSWSFAIAAPFRFQYGMGAVHARLTRESPDAL